MPTVSTVEIPAADPDAILRAKLVWRCNAEGNAGELTIEDPNHLVVMPNYTSTETPFEAIVKFKLPNGALIWPLAGANNRFCVSGTDEQLRALLDQRQQSALNDLQQICPPNSGLTTYLKVRAYGQDNAIIKIKQAIQDLVNGPIYDWNAVIVVDVSG